MIIRVQQQRAVRAGACVHIEHVGDIDIEQRIAINDDETILQLVKTGQCGASRAARIAIVDERDRTSEILLRDESLDLNRRRD